MSKEMTLWMRIRANGDEARRMFKQLNHDAVEFQKNQKEMWSGFGSAAATPFKMIGSAGGIMFAPLKIAAEAAGALTGGLIALGSAAIYAAAEDEKLESRLAAVSGSALRGAHAMRALESMSMHGTFKTADLGEAWILMKNYGIDSQRALRAVATAAKAAGVGVGELALQTMALQSRGMKRFGIELDDTKDNPVIKFRDRMGQIRTIVTKDADEARRKLVEVFALKFGTNISPKTFGGFMSMLKNNIDQVFSNFGEGLLPAAKRFIDYISGGLTKAIESGDIKKWGEKAGEWLNESVTKFMAVMDTLQQVFGNIPKLMADGASGLVQVLQSVLSGVANTLGVALVEYLIAAKDIFIGLGKIIGGALMEEILKLDIPGVRSVREKGVRSALAGMTEEQAKAAGINPEFAGNVDRMMSPEKADQRDAEINDFIKNLDPSRAAHFATQGFRAGDMLLDGARDFRDAVTTLKTRVAATASESFAGINTAFKSGTGFDISENYKNNLTRRRVEADAFGKESVTARYSEMYSPDPDRPWNKMSRPHDVTKLAKSGAYEVGQRVPGNGVIIHIEKLNVTASDAGRVQHEIINSATKGASLGFAH